MSPRRPQVRELLIRIDGDAKAPLGRQVEEQLREAIRCGRLAAGEQLPSTRMLANDLAVSRGVIARAYGQLAAEGYLAVRQGANPYVAPLLSQQAQTRAQPKENGRRWRFDLRPESPDLSQFPRRQWSRSLQCALKNASDRELGYIDRCGLPQLRRELSAYLARVRGADVDPDRVLITAGSTHTLTLIGRALLRQGQTRLAFENPSHCLLHTMVRRTGLEPTGIPVDDDGLVVDKLEQSDVKCVVVSPAHQFPLGVALAPERRMQLLEWAKRSDCILVEDDYDAEFRYDRPPAECLQALEPERVVYLGSASKSLAPALRLGWAILPSSLVEPVSAELHASTLLQPSLEQLAFADFLARGEFDRHVHKMRASYQRRRDLTITALQAELPELPLRGIAAGLNLIVELPGQEQEETALRNAAAAGIAVETVTRHTLAGYCGPRGLLISFAEISEPTIPHAIRSLAQALHGQSTE
jgi:GntR family transcriptional regulator / MocR family aminotransferase